MIWLPRLLKEIDVLVLSEEQRRTAYELAVQLSEICDAHVPHAHAPSVIHELDLVIGWWVVNTRRGSKDRELLLVVDPKGAYVLNLHHHGHEQTLTNVSPGDMRSSVRSLFEAWTPS